MKREDRRRTADEPRPAEAAAGRKWTLVSGRGPAGSGHGRSSVFRRTLVAVVCGLLSAVFLVACGGGADTTEPPEMLYGQDVCDECGMIISEEKYAAAYWTEDGQARRFDDVGEMLVFMAQNPEPAASVWVHDLNSAAWLPAGEAWFVTNSGLRTPMGTGIAVLAEEQAARALAFDQPGAVVLSYDEIVALAAAGALENTSGMGE